MDSRARMCEHVGADERGSSAGERHPIGLGTAGTPIISLPDGTHSKALATNVLFLSTRHHPQRTNQRDGPTAGVNTQQKTRTYKKTPKVRT